MNGFCGEKPFSRLCEDEPLELAAVLGALSMMECDCGLFEYK